MLLLSLCETHLEEGRIRGKGSYGDFVPLFINLAPSQEELLITPVM